MRERVVTRVVKKQMYKYHFSFVNEKNGCINFIIMYGHTLQFIQTLKFGLYIHYYIFWWWPGFEPDTLYILCNVHTLYTLL